MDATESLVQQQQRMRESCGRNWTARCASRIRRPETRWRGRAAGSSPGGSDGRPWGRARDRAALLWRATARHRLVPPARPADWSSMAPDGLGRSTHVALLKEWLEARGYAVVNTGLRRSELAGRGIERAKRGNTLDPLTLNLLYATDFWDRMERQIPARAARPGMVARSTATSSRSSRGESPRPVSGLDREPVRFALVPDLVVYSTSTWRISGAAGAEHDWVRLLGVGPGLSPQPGRVPQLRRTPDPTDWHEFRAWPPSTRLPPSDAGNHPDVFRALWRGHRACVQGQCHARRRPRGGRPCVKMLPS